MKNLILTTTVAWLLHIAAAQALSPGVHKCETTGGKLVLVHGIYQDEIHYCHNYSFYFQPNTSEDWLQVPIMEKKGIPGIGWNSASHGEITLADATVVQRSDGLYFVTASKQRNGSPFDPGDVTVVWYHLLAAGDNDHDGPAQQFSPASTRAIRAVPDGVDVILEKEARLPFVQKHPAEILAAQKIGVPGKAVRVLRVVGKTDEKFLVLAENPVKSQTGHLERINLSASLYTKTGQQWKSAWSINDFGDCPGNDSKAAFLPEATTVTDIDNDGSPEFTVAYQLSCSGTADPATVRVILRQGETKFAIRGESQLRLPGKTAVGGTRTPDPLLQQPKNVAYLKHLESVWKEVYVEKR